MPQITTKCKVLKVEMLCDRCKKGMMEPTGIVLYATYPPRYVHRCNVCGYMGEYNEGYPYLVAETDSGIMKL